MSANISILGNAGRDVSLSYKEKGGAVASFPVASNSFRNSAEGRVQVTHWFNVTAFGKQAETVAEHVKKGTYLLIHGRLSFTPWLTEDGDARSGAEVTLFSFEFAGSKGDGERHAATENIAIPQLETPADTGTQSSESKASEPFVDQF